MAAAGALFDVLTSRLSARLRVAGVWAPVILVAAMAASLRQADDFETRLGRQDPLFPLRQAFAAPIPGRRVDLNGGTVAWMLKNPHRATRGLAIIVHGNHPAGSWQPAALALQGALLRAGFDVLSVDHPGYGASAHPPASADWTAWDPRIGLREALAYARSLPSQKSAPITLVGHSMGVDTTLMWLDEGLPVKDVYLFSGAITRPPDSVQAESELWHAQRNMSCCIDPVVMSQIRSHFYADASVYAQALPADHPPLHFTRSGIEYADVAEDREILYPVLTAPKEVCDLPGVTHYMNTLSIRRSTVLDTAAIVEVAGLFDGTGIGPNGTTPCSQAPSKLPPPPPH
jgi:pimeloyl-ACP methyl ester carboxylesterase